MTDSDALYLDLEDSLKALFPQNLETTTRGRLGYTLDGAYRVRVPNRPNYYYVHFGPNSYVEAFNWGGVAPIPDLAVTIGYMQTKARREAVILSPDIYAIEEYSEGDVSPTVGPHTHDSPPLLDPVSSYRFRPGLLRLDSAGSLLIYIEPFNYIFDGLERRHPGGVFDLAPHVPLSGKNWCKIWYDLDQADFVARVGDLLPLAAPDPSLADLTLIAKPTTTESCIPIGGVILYEGQVTPPEWRHFGDARVFLGGVDMLTPEDIKGLSDTLDSGTASWPRIITTAVTVPEDRQVVVAQIVIGEGGSLIVNGILKAV